MRATLTLGTAAAAVLLAAAATAVPPSPAGTVTFLDGEATRSAAGASEKLAKGGAVGQGDLIETQRRTRLELRLSDGSVLRLGPSSKAVLVTATFGSGREERKFSAKLLAGRIWANVAKAVGGSSRFEVETEHAVAGVRGTTFRVDAATDRSVVVKVYSGTVVVASGPIPRREHGAAPAERRRVPGPTEISREQWERLVTGMMQVRVSAEGVPGEPEAFALAAGGGDEWEEWNRGRDAAR